MNHSHDDTPYVPFPSQPGLSPSMTLVVLAVVGLSSTVVLFGLADAMVPPARTVEVDRSVPTVPSLESVDGTEVVARATAEEVVEPAVAEVADDDSSQPTTPRRPQPAVRRGGRLGNERPASTVRPSPAPGEQRRGLGRLTDDPLQDVDFGNGSGSIFDA